MGARVHDSVAERVTTAVAGVGVTMPAWWHYIETTSNLFAMMVPILSAIWLVVQIVRALSRLGDAEDR